MGLPPQLKMVGTLFPTPKPILLRSNNNTFLFFSEARWLTSLKRTSYHSLTVTRVILVVIGSSLETTTTTTQVVVNSLSQPVRPPDRGQSSVPAATPVSFIVADYAPPAVHWPTPCFPFHPLFMLHLPLAPQPRTEATPLPAAETRHSDNALWTGA